MRHGLNTSSSARAFALLLVLALLALVVLVIVAFSALTKVGNDIARAREYQVQARQNALMGLGKSLNDLQNAGGQTGGATAKADIDPSCRSENRHWTGVWMSSNVVKWLASGDVSPSAFSPAIELQPPLSSSGTWRVMSTNPNHVVLVGEKTINTGSASLTYVTGDAIVVPRVALASVSDRSGGYAYWVGDEGVKLSMIAIDDVTSPDAVPEVSLLRTDITLLFSSFNPDVPAVTQLLMQEQIPLIKSGLRLAQNYHNYTLNAVSIQEGLPRGLPARYRRLELTDGTYEIGVSGALNLNTTNLIAWRALYRLACVNAGVAVPGEIRQTNFAISMINLLREGTGDKPAATPFFSVEDFRFSEALVRALSAGGSPAALTPARFVESLEPLINARSDTFRIRAYGDAGTVTDEGVFRIEAKAYCEAIVQRLPEALDSARPQLGNRLKIVSFRWLTPADI